jgi:uncharacterized protein
MLVLNLSTIRTAREHFERIYQPEELGVDPDFRVVAPVSLSFDVDKDKTLFRIVGTVKTTLELPCGRCLEPFTMPVDQSFDLRYQPHVAGDAKDEERELEEDDLTTAFYESNEIDLDHLMREQFQLSLPMKPLCSASCHGLCPVCGTNLNRETCACTREWEDPRLAALRELKKKTVDVREKN